MGQTLWAPWRMEYLTGERPEGCVFCAALAAGPARDAETLILARRRHSFVIMNRFPYTYGHLMVLPHRHVSWLTDLEDEERRSLFDLTADAQAALSETVKPAGINLGMNQGRPGGAGIDDHIHVHLVPRWVGDVNFMPLLAETRVMPDHLSSIYDTLRPAFVPLSEDR